MEVNIETLTLLIHYLSLISVTWLVSQLPAVRAASNGGKFKINWWKFTLSMTLVIVVREFVSALLRENVPSAVNLIVFAIAFYSEEIYDYLKTDFFKKVLKKFEKKYLDEDKDHNTGGN